MVQEVYESACPESPHQRDGMQRRLSRHVVQHARARILNHTYNELYAIFTRTNPNIELSRTKFRQLAPWNLKKAYRETCLCRCCELFKLYVAALNTVAAVLRPLINTDCDSDAESDSDGDGESSEPAVLEAGQALRQLVKFCSHEHKTTMVNDLVCGGCVDTAKPACVHSTCAKCGFKVLWRPVRKTLVDAYGQLRPGMPAAWQTRVRYEVLKSGSSAPSDGSASDEKDTLRERKTATLIEILDEFEKVSLKFPAHRHLVRAAKAAALQRDRNFWVGMLLSDYDWAENGVIVSARQIQSEYWSLVYYSLFIQITTHLDADAWFNRRSVLPMGTEVTVMSEDDDFASIKPARGAFYAKVHSGASNEGEEQLYSVTVYGHPTLSDGTVRHDVKRKCLRHRLKCTVATIGVTDEKRHDAVTTQHFLNQQFQHWLLSRDRQQFWAWIGHSDNASHFKSGAMMNYWSKKSKEVDFLDMCWIDFGCPGHGKGPWDGLGAVLKQQVTRDITNSKILTESGGLASNSHLPTNRL